MTKQNFLKDGLLLTVLMLCLNFTAQAEESFAKAR